MIFEYGAKNCWCFKDWLKINLRINKNVPAQYGFTDARVAPFLCFEGANASGKTSGLKILSFIGRFAAFSFFNQENDSLYYSSFFHNKGASDFYINFALPDSINTEYIYKLKVTEEAVISETLYKKEDGARTVILKRYRNNISINTLFDPAKKLPLRNNVSVISTAHQFGFAEIEPFYKFFNRINSNLSSINGPNTDVKNIITKYYIEHPDVLNKIVHELKRFDTGVETVEIKQYKDENDVLRFIPLIEHKTDDGMKELLLIEESTGTEFLFYQLLEIYFALGNGGVLVADELDSHLHSRITYEIIRYFANFEINKSHAQLLFTSHDSKLLDSAKKYRTYIFEKEMGESYAYRIDEIKDKNLLRNDKPLSPIYETGILGGVPHVAEN